MFNLNVNENQNQIGSNSLYPQDEQSRIFNSLINKLFLAYINIKQTFYNKILLI